MHAPAQSSRSREASSIAFVRSTHAFAASSYALEKSRVHKPLIAQDEVTSLQTRLKSRTTRLHGRTMHVMGHAARWRCRGTRLQVHAEAREGSRGAVLETSDACEGSNLVRAAACAVAVTRCASVPSL
jgi:hypothetical protein